MLLFAEELPPINKSVPGTKLMVKLLELRPPGKILKLPGITGVSATVKTSVPVEGARSETRGETAEARGEGRLCAALYCREVICRHRELRRIDGAGSGRASNVEDVIPAAIAVIHSERTE